MSLVLNRRMGRSIIISHLRASSAVSRTGECSLYCGKVTDQRQRLHSSPLFVQIRDGATSRVVAPSSTSLIHLIQKTSTAQNHNFISRQIRLFRNVGEYHDVADDTLHSIQDAVEELIEDELLRGNTDDVDDIPEVNYASGVLTIYLPPHGTWVINKQTPNEQLWWSSPISGPRRYEYVEGRKRWVYTRVGDGGEHAAVSSVAEGEGEEDTLGQILVQEIKELYGCDLELEA
ncbi:hypothetical protein ACHAW6_015977 [Cyclotella cf. meneghiniana]